MVEGKVLPVLAVLAGVGVLAWAFLSAGKTQQEVAAERHQEAFNAEAAACSDRECVRLVRAKYGIQ